jgi:hypothetical protein
MKGRKDSQTNSNADRDVDARSFVRVLIENHDAVVFTPAAERTLCGALNAVEMTKSNSHFTRTDCNHIFLNVIPIVRIDVEDMKTNMWRIVLALRCSLPVVAYLCRRSQSMQVLFRMYKLRCIFAS